MENFIAKYAIVLHITAGEVKKYQFLKNTEFDCENLITQGNVAHVSKC